MPIQHYGLLIFNENLYKRLPGCDDFLGMPIINITAPTSQREIARLETPGYAYDVHIAGDLALVADGTSGLRIVDISNPSKVDEIGHFLPDGGDVRGVDVVGSFAYLASGNPGLVIVEISDPRNPKEVATIDTPQTARSIRLDGSYAYVGDLKWLRVIDISTPTARDIRGQFT